jgi:hypothetical protein
MPSLNGRVGSLFAFKVQRLSASYSFARQIGAVHGSGTDIIVDYFHAIVTGLDGMPGQFGATYAIPIIYVPLLMITHVTAFYLLLRSKGQH